MTRDLVRETRSRIYPVFMFAAIGFLAGWLMFGSFGRPTNIVVETSREIGIASTTKVDNLDIAGTTAAHGLVSLSAGITGLPVNACGAGTATTAISTTGTASCSTFFNTAGDHLSSSGSTVSLAPIATARFLGRTSAGPGNVEDLTGTQATALLDTVSITAKGLAPTLPNDATKYLDGTGNYTVPAGGGGGVTSVSAGTGISVTGTTAVTVGLNITPTTCGSGQAITAISATGVGTCTAIASAGAPQWIFGTGSDGAQVFNGVTTPVAGATLSGSTYTMTRDIFCHGCTINAGISVTGPYRFYDDDTLTLNGNINRNGNAASGATAGATLTSGSLPAGIGAGNGGSNTGAVAGSGGNANSSPRDCTAGQAAAGASGSMCGGGGGGAGAGGTGGLGGNVTLAAASLGDIRTWYQAPLGRQSNNSVYTTPSGGGGGRGDATNVKTGGGGGGAAGYMFVALHAVTGTGDIEAKGGAGADGQTGGNTGGGGGGSGGYINLVIGSGSCPTMVVTGGLHGLGQGTGTNGGDGGIGVTHCFGP